MLREAGVELASAALIVERREDRLIARLPGNRLAWFPANDRGRARLDTDRRVLRLLAQRCSFQVPRLLFVSDSG